ncbi:type II secretion system protein GspE [Salibacterium salarium]|uniref:Type II secretion system protein GspE n=1 Tax=Salibacterium salarium TaxID=284579 RepID=A0A428N2D1_9BACI|nr:ATPase, T2SS/T4P/T4SS family [Salibacterium salarium]RSL32624.1 type II secretion system protein GspE [Salibacterium salarium]
MAEKRKRLGDLLLEANVITEQQLDAVLKTKRNNQKLGDALLERQYINEQQLIEALEYQLGIPRISLHNHPVEENAIRLLTKEFAMRHVLLPLKLEGQRLRVAMADPMDYFAIDELRVATGFHVDPVIATRQELSTYIQKHYHIQQSLEEFEEKNRLEDVNEEGNAGDDAPVIRMVDQMISYGLQQEASDIHIDPQESKVLVRYRVDGVLKTDQAFPKNMQNALTARIKIMADLNITETRLPQDGRVKTTVDMHPIDLRISILPTVFGEKIVLRIMDLGSSLNNISELGFNKINYNRFKHLIEQPSGMVLLTGPTGSGKTSTLYAGLHHLNTVEVNIITVEDPVEYQLEGINQMQVNNEIGLTFATGLRSILRQDPNIVMVGEIRDSETAEIAIRASLTGHLVFSTLHTNSAIATVPRLMDMGVEPYMVVSSLSGVVAQRLVRKICSNCREQYEPSKMEKELFEKRGITPGPVYKGTGCSACNDTGYRGRSAIHELLEMDDTIRNMLMNHESIASLRQYAMKEGMIFLIDDGLLKVKQGWTTIEEILRVAVDE